MPLLPSNSTLQRDAASRPQNQRDFERRFLLQCRCPLPVAARLNVGRSAAWAVYQAGGHGAK